MSERQDEFFAVGKQKGGEGRKYSWEGKESAPFVSALPCASLWLRSATYLPLYSPPISSPAAAICMGRHTVKAPHKRQWRPLALSPSTRKLFREKLPAAWGMCQKALNASSRLHLLPIAAILPSSLSSIVSFGLTASAQCDSPSPSNQWTDGPQLILITPPPLPLRM